MARYLASCGEITRDNKGLARLRQDKLRELVRCYFDAQLAQYLEWINSRGLSPMAIEDSRCEMLDHVDDLDSHRPTTTYLPIDRFKRKMDVSDEDWFDSLPNALTELRKGRRDLLGLDLEAAERTDGYLLGQCTSHAITPPCAPCGGFCGFGCGHRRFHGRAFPSVAGKDRRTVPLLFGDTAGVPLTGSAAGHRDQTGCKRPQEDAADAASKPEHEAALGKGCPCRKSSRSGVQRQSPPRPSTVTLTYTGASSRGQNFMDMHLTSRSTG